MRKVDVHKEMFKITITDPVKMSDRISKLLQVLNSIAEIKKMKV